MPRDPQEFARFLANHYRPIEAMCRQRMRFTSDNEIMAFLRPFEADDKNLAPLVGLMRTKGVLIELAGEWCPPPFLVSFIDQLALRHVLASPKVIRGWIETLDGHIETLMRQVDAAGLELGTTVAAECEVVIRDIDETFQNIVRTVQDNCARIADEVAEYRKTENAGRIRSRLNRLIQLHDEYLEPVIRIVEVGGEFYTATEKVRNCCSRIGVPSLKTGGTIKEDAKFLQKEITWLRRVVVRGAEEARRELAPLCEAAARESQIARGVNRSLEAIIQGDWTPLALDANLLLVVDKDATTFSDQAIRQFLANVIALEDQIPPAVPSQPLETFAIPLTADDLIEKLQSIDLAPDLLDWVLDCCDELNLGEAVRLFHAVLGREPAHVSHSNERKQYRRGDFAVEATKWTWKGPDHGNRDNEPNGRPPTCKSRERVSVP